MGHIEWCEIRKIIGMSRSNYYRCRQLEYNFGIKGLIPKSKRPEKLRKSKFTQDLINLVEKLRKADPTYGKAKISTMCAGHDVRAKGLSPSWADIERSIS